MEHLRCAETTIRGMDLAVSKEQKMIKKEIFVPAERVNSPVGLIDFLHQRKQGL
jgi:hypothetical protein